MRTSLAIGIAVALLSGVSSAATVIPTPIGTGPLFHPRAASASTARGLPVGSLTCSRSGVSRVGTHLELFARGRVVIVPAGIGIAPPLRREGAVVLTGRCSYPVRTREPTGVIELAAPAKVTLGDFFAVWGKPLGPHRLVGFGTDARSPVRAYVDGRRYRGPPGSIRLRRHREIVLELGKFVPPHASYRFRSGL